LIKLPCFTGDFGEKLSSSGLGLQHAQRLRHREITSGRTHRTYTPDFNAELVAAYQYAGVSIAAFASSHGMKPNVPQR